MEPKKDVPTGLQARVPRWMVVVFVVIPLLLLSLPFVLVLAGVKIKPSDDAPRPLSPRQACEAAVRGDLWGKYQYKHDRLEMLGPGLLRTGGFSEPERVGGAEVFSGRGVLFGTDLTKEPTLRFGYRCTWRDGKLVDHDAWR